MSKRFTVTGSGHFPIDMLRYDGAYPADPSAVETLSREQYRSRRSIRLVGTSPSAPTVGRWNSFGWLVEEVEKF